MTSPDPEAGAFTRPPPDDIRAGWNTLFSDPMLSLASLKAEGVGPGLGAAAEDGGVLLRSVYWRFYLGLLPPPTSLELFPPALASARRAYDDLRGRYLVAPDGRWAADCTGGEGYAMSSPKGSASTWIDPLSLDGDGESPWKTWFAHIDLRATIRQDVDRTFPDIPYFGIERVRRMLTTMLFLFAVTNPDVGYRQGMHELLAVCLLVVDRDSLVAEPNRTFQSPLSTTPAAVRDEAMVVTLDRAYTEHDAFQLFIQLMKPAKEFYEWRAEEGTAHRRASAPVAPIITRCGHIQAQLRHIDPQLWQQLETEGVEPQIWAIRWLRLVLTRELPLSDALRLWDGIFAEDPSLQILDYVCLAMLLLIRNELIHADYPTLLTHLLHYPAPSATYPFKAALILTQAKILRHNVSSASGAEVVMQNHELLGVKASGPDRDSGDHSAALEPESTTPATYFFGRGMSPSPRPGSASRNPAKARAGMQGLAAGLFERAQKAGLDKAFMSTVNDLRSSLPDSSTAYSFLPSFSPSGPGTREHTPGLYSSIPSSTSALPTGRYDKQALNDDAVSIHSAKSLLDAERQLAEVRLAMLSMGKAMTEWMTVLRGASASSGENADVADAWKGLDRVRDTLLEAAGREVDDLVKDWAWNEVLDTSRSRSSSSQPTPVDPDTEQSLARSGLLGPSGSPPIALQQEITPKALATERLQKSSHLPAPPVRTSSIASSPAPQAQAQGKTPPVSMPQLHLSSRDSAPSSGLSRTTRALHHPQPSAATAGSNARRLSDQLDGAKLQRASTFQPGTRGRVVSPPLSPSPVSGDMDPLAGLGVETIPLDSSAQRRSGIWRASPSGSGSATSPRMSVGADPLGAM